MTPRNPNEAEPPKTTRDNKDEPRELDEHELEQVAGGYGVTGPRPPK